VTDSAFESIRRGIDRRRFLYLTGGAAATSLVSDTLMSSIVRAAEIPAHHVTGTLRDVEHIVVLMQENRSFDHYFGSLRGVRGFGDPHPVTLPSGKSVWYQSDGTRDVLPFHPSAANLGLQFLEDLPHGWNDTHAAWNQGRYDRWIPAKSAVTMAYLMRQDIPFHYALADAFTICDAYHCSFMGSTDPNRYYMWTGYTGNDGAGGGPVLGNDEVGYSWMTYPERLERARISWKMYQDIGDGLDAAGAWGWIEDAFRGNYGDNSLLYFKQYQNAAAGNPLYDKARTGTNAKQGQSLFDIFAADVKSGALPQISWIVAPEAYTEHPNWPANYGAWYIAQVLDALTANPDVWSRTVLLVTYDENDGFFDHIVPPYPPGSVAHGASTVDVGSELFSGSAAHPAGPYGLGQRVPMLVVSPWSKGGWVCSQVYDHTSIVQFMEQRFGVHEPNISPWRRAVCGDLTAAFDFARPESAVTSLPNTAAYMPPDHNRHPDYVPTVPTNQTLPKQEPGVRQARPLPYDLAADASVEQHRLKVAFANDGDAGATFYVTSTAIPGGPWTYTVGSGQHLNAEWSLAAGGDHPVYDLTVHGPNGFVREIRGSEGAAAPQVTARQAGRSDQLQLMLKNDGNDTLELTVTSAYGKQQPKTYALSPHAATTVIVDLGSTSGWYDLAVVTASDTTFMRHLVGHVETGRPSTSDPAIMTT
jgi:phospholipase C